MREAAASKARLVVTRGVYLQCIAMQEKLSLICIIYFSTKDFLSPNRQYMKVEVDSIEIQFFQILRTWEGMAPQQWVAARRRHFGEHLGAGECSFASCVSCFVGAGWRHRGRVGNTSGRTPRSRTTVFPSRVLRLGATTT